MKYLDRPEVRLGDRVRMGDDSGGVVVFSIDTDEYSEEYPKADWAYLGVGVGIKFPKYGLIHFAAKDQDLELISRATHEADAG